MSTTFRINRVYTRSGDDGTTGLVGAERVAKTDQRVVAFGDVDELNSVLGLVRCEVASGRETSGVGVPDKRLDSLLLELQQELFDLGSELATKTEYPGMWRTETRHVERLEKLCDEFGEGLPELQSFIIPGGERCAALLHLARTVARRAERSLVELAAREGSSFNSETVKYLNRVSDLMFVLSRYRLKTIGVDQPLWVKEKERGG